MKKPIAIILSAALLLMTLMTLTACGSTTASAASEETAAATTESSAAPTDDLPVETLEGNPPGDPPDGNAGPDGTPPGDPPDGNGGPDGTPPGDPPDGNGGPGGTPPGGFGGGMPGGGPGGSSADIDYTGAAEIRSADSQSGQTYASTTADESALLISAADEVSITDPTVTKSGDSDGGDNCNFYGLNAAVLVKDGTTATITGGTVTSDAEGANGVFC